MEQPKAAPTPPTGSAASDVLTTEVRRHDRRDRFTLRVIGVEPLARLLATGIAIALRLGLGALADLVFPTQLRRQRREARRVRATESLVATLGVLKGAFVKAGQFASVRHDLLPAGAEPVLATLQQNVPPLRFELAQRVIERDLGQPLAQLFRHVEREPIGAASVAQVHRARLFDGSEVAVKVQYPWIEASLPADLRLIRAGVRLLARWRGRRGFEPDHLVDEFAEGLRDELDFRREADAAEEIAHNLRDTPGIVVPDVIHSHSGTRVLTVSYHPTLSLADRAALVSRGIDTRRVLERIAHAYAKQVFVDGHFHADPHPGNVFVLDEPGVESDPRILFVDFGLCRRLDPELRRRIRAGIHALIQRDIEGFLSRMDEMGMIAPGAHDGIRAAVAEMFERIAQTAGAGIGGALGIAGSQVLSLKDEAKALLRDTPGLQLPNDLLLYAKTLAYLFALGEALDPETDLLKLSLPYVLRFLAERDDS